MPQYFAKIENDEVARVIVCDSNNIKNYSGEWIETFMGNNYAGIGKIFDRVNKKFHIKRPHNGWTLINNIWTPPTPPPNDGKNHEWDEDREEWKIKI